MKSIFGGSVLTALCLCLIIPGKSRADISVAFSNTGQTGGTISGNTVTGVIFNTIIVGSTPYFVNDFSEAYANGVLDFSVMGSGSLSNSGPFTNVSGTFITIDESNPVFGTNPQSINLLTTVNSLNLSSTFQNDIGFSLASQIYFASGTIVAITTQTNGTVISTEANLQFGTVPEPPAFWMAAIGVGLLAVRSWRKAGARKHQTESHQGGFAGQANHFSEHKVIQ